MYLFYTKYNVKCTHMPMLLSMLTYLYHKTNLYPSLKMASFPGHNQQNPFLILCLETLNLKTWISVFSFSVSLTDAGTQMRFLTSRFLSSSMVLKSWENSFKDWAAKEMTHLKSGKTWSYLIYFCTASSNILDHFCCLASHLYWSHHQSRHLQYTQTGTPVETVRTAEQQEKDLREKYRESH